MARKLRAQYPGAVYHVEEAVRAGGHKTKQAAVSAAIAEYVQRRHRLRLLELEGKIEFDPRWDYKKMRTA